LIVIESVLCEDRQDQHTATWLDSKNKLRESRFMQVKQQGQDSQVHGLREGQLKGSVHEERRTCHQVGSQSNSSLLKLGAFLTPSQCKKTLIKLNLHKGKARKSRLRVLVWLHLSAGKLMGTKQKVTYKVIPKEIGSND
jgi:hypothetical protein